MGAGVLKVGMPKRFQLQIWIDGMHDDWHVVTESDSDLEIGREASKAARQFQDWKGVDVEEDIRIFDRKLNCIF